MACRGSGVRVPSDPPKSTVKAGSMLPISGAFVSCSHLLVTSRFHGRGASIRLVVSPVLSAAPAHLRGMGHKASREGGLDRALSLSELAARLGVKPQAIYDLRSEGRGPAGFRIGSQLRFR